MPVIWLLVRKSNLAPGQGHGAWPMASTAAYGCFHKKCGHKKSAPEDAFDFKCCLGVFFLAAASFAFGF